MQPPTVVLDAYRIRELQKHIVDADLSLQRQAAATRRSLLSPHIDLLRQQSTSIHSVHVYYEISTPGVPRCLLLRHLRHAIPTVEVPGLPTTIRSIADLERGVVERRSPRLTRQQRERFLSAFHDFVASHCHLHSNITSVAIDYDGVLVTVQRKGYIPWDEDVLPTAIGGARVRVREGRAYLAGRHEFADPIHPGAEIAPAPSLRNKWLPGRGTLGCYLPSQERFLTCAHVIDALCIHHYRKVDVPSVIVTQPHQRKWTAWKAARTWWEKWKYRGLSSCEIGTSDVNAYGSIMHPVVGGTEKLEFGVDASLCKIAVPPPSRSFHSDPLIPLDPDGFQPQLCFDVDWDHIVLGKDVIPHDALVVKRGCATGTTYGIVDCLGVPLSVQMDQPDAILVDEELECNCDNTTVAMFRNLYRLLPTNVSTIDRKAGSFAQKGDSGSLVFVVWGKVLRPLALLIAASEDGVGWATPIEAVLDALHLKSLRECRW